MSRKRALLFSFFFLVGHQRESKKVMADYKKEEEKRSADAFLDDEIFTHVHGLQGKRPIVHVKISSIIKRK